MLRRGERFNEILPGQYFDKETGLHYNYFRDYDPSTGRYVQSDPIGLRGGINTFSYVGNDPLSYFDELGLASVCYYWGFRIGNEFFKGSKHGPRNKSLTWTNMRPDVSHGASPGLPSLKGPSIPIGPESKVRGYWLDRTYFIWWTITDQWARVDKYFYQCQDINGCDVSPWYQYTTDQEVLTRTQNRLSWDIETESIYVKNPLGDFGLPMPGPKIPSRPTP